jgi:hypothetical protein
LGISGVGTWVILAVIVMLAGVPEWLTGLTTGGLVADAFAVMGLVFIVVLIQVPFDLFGGHILPRKHGRTTEHFAGFARRWIRGAAAYHAMYAVVGLCLLPASRVAGAPGMVLVGIGSSIVLLMVRTPIACLVGGMRPAQSGPASGSDAAVVSSQDVGFTGGVEGVFRAGRQVVPQRWFESLSPEMLSLALRRRREAVASGFWLRGRITSLAFTWLGLVIAGSQVGGLVGTAGGVVVFAAVFTLWSFVGLLVLPTLSRHASMMIDERLIAHGTDLADLTALAGALDSMQDDEPSRPKWVERIFHPIPNVTSRSGERTLFRFAAWDVARTSVYLGISGLSPLGRAVHCNSGRPSLWIYLPVN